MSAEIKNRPQDLWGIAIRECWNKGVLEQGSTKQGRGGGVEEESRSRDPTETFSEEEESLLNGFLPHVQRTAGNGHGKAGKGGNKG